MTEAIEKLRLMADWARDDGAMSKFLHNAMRLIEDNIELKPGKNLTINPELYQQLLDDLVERNIFKGEVITFMAPIHEENKEKLIVAASTKEITAEGKPLKGLPCGKIALDVYSSDSIGVKVIENQDSPKKTPSNYSGKSYLYPIVDIDQPTGRSEIYGVIGIAQLQEEYLPENYVDLLASMGKAIGRQLGRVVERVKADTILKAKNDELRERALDLEKAFLDIKNLLHGRDQQLALQDFLFGTINHDFKRSIMGVMGQVQSLFDLADDNLANYLDRICLNINETLELIKMVDDLNKVAPEAIPMQKFLEEYRENVSFITPEPKKAKNTTLTWDIDGDESIYFDRQHLKRVLNNCLSNAIKYSPTGGEVHIASKLLSKKENQFIEISISDQGIGIEKEALSENIFKARWRTAAAEASGIEGTGVGLGYVKYIIDKSEGDIHVLSRPGKTNNSGIPFVSTFILQFPVYSSEEVISDSSCSVIVCGEKDDDNNFKEKALQHMVEDLEQALGITAFSHNNDIDSVVKNIQDYNVAVSMDLPEKNAVLIQAAKKTGCAVICINKEEEQVYVISNGKEVSVPSSTFSIVAPDLISLE